MRYAILALIGLFGLADAAEANGGLNFRFRQERSRIVVRERFIQPPTIVIRQKQFVQPPRVIVRQQKVFLPPQQVYDYGVQPFAVQPYQSYNYDFQQFAAPACGYGYGVQQLGGCGGQFRSAPFLSLNFGY